MAKITIPKTFWSWPGSPRDPEVGDPLVTFRYDQAFEFIDAIRNDKKPNAEIEIGHLTASLCHLGNIATRLGRSLEFDPLKEQFIDDERANRLVSRIFFSRRSSDTSVWTTKAPAASASATASRTFLVERTLALRTISRSAAGNCVIAARSACSAVRPVPSDTTNTSCIVTSVSTVREAPSSPG